MITIDDIKRFLFLKKRDYQEEILDVIDWGTISTLSTTERQLKVNNNSETCIYCDIDALLIKPDKLSSIGDHTILLNIDTTSVMPDALIEGMLKIESNGKVRRYRITGSVDPAIIQEETSSSVVYQHPWQLINKYNGHLERARSVSFLTDHILVSGSVDKTVIWWNIDGKQENIQEFEAEVWSVTTSRDGKYTAVGLQNGSIYVYEGYGENLLWDKNIHNGMISDLAFTPDGDILAAGSGDRSISLWNNENGNLRFPPLIPPMNDGRRPGVVSSIAISRLGNVLASAAQTREISMWDISTGEFLRKMIGHQGNVWCVEFSLDGHILASGSHDKTIRLWDTQSGYLVNSLTGFERDIYSIAISPDGNIVASSSGEPKVRIWQTISGNRLANLEYGNVIIWKLAFSPDGRKLAGASDNGDIYLWAVG